MFESTYECLLTTITLITVALQIYVFYLVKNKSPRKMGHYRFFLYNFTIFDLMFTLLLGLLLQPAPALPIVASKVQGLCKYLGFEASLVTCVLIFYTGTNVVVYQNLSLIYRYSILHSNKFIKNLFASNCSKFTCTLAVQLVSVTLTFFWYRIFLPKESNSYFINYLNKPEFQEYHTQIQEGDILLVVDMFKWKTRWFLKTLLVLFVISEISSIILVVLIFLTLRRNMDSFSHNAYKVHKQFSLLLGVQLLIPIVFVFFPFAGCIFLIQIGQMVSRETINMGFVLLSSYAFFNALFTILFVSSYRWHAYENLIRPWLEPICKCAGLAEKLPKQKIVEAPPTTTDRYVPRNKIDVVGGCLQLVEANGLSAKNNYVQKY